MVQHACCICNLYAYDADLRNRQRAARALAFAAPPSVNGASYTLQVQTLSFPPVIGLFGSAGAEEAR
eukprot:356621-Chlamydomonas_euryale.AAC.7